MKATKRFLLTLAAILSMTGAWAEDADDNVAVTKTANTNEWTLTMPASDVELLVEYYENLNSADDLTALVTNFAGKAASVAHTRSFTVDVPSTICQPTAKGLYIQNGKKVMVK